MMHGSTNAQLREQWVTSFALTCCAPSHDAWQHKRATEIAVAQQEEISTVDEFHLNAIAILTSSVHCRVKSTN